ncbi:hypothetical protein BJ742DRAFT_674460 [Cladochytrium replicatum]|nr:hypothetical protein BJ742DRAFT_674460 [Cladochytrium replicatum]
MTGTEVLGVDINSEVEQEVLDDEPRSILLGLISQLRKGMDLHRVTLPTFVLEPRSMCERVTDFMSHPELIIHTHLKEDPVERFIDVVRFFLSGWHIKPKGVKKPYNPVLGEFFRCRWNFSTPTSPGATSTVPSTSLYVSEQVSHHPPISAWYYVNPRHKLVISGDVRPKSRFLGNSAATLMGGTTRIVMRDRPDEVYEMGLPNVYARGIVFGTMYMDVADAVVVRCKKSGLVAEIDFKVKGFFGGEYNGVGGQIKREKSGEVLHTISGRWSDTIYIQKGDAGGVSLGGKSKPQVLFEVAKHSIVPKMVPTEAEQEDFESRKLWSKVTRGLATRNLDAATAEKSAIENRQRKLGKERAEKGVEWKPRFFSLDAENDTYNFKLGM